MMLASVTMSVGEMSGSSGLAKFARPGGDGPGPERRAGRRVIGLSRRRFVARMDYLLTTSMERCGARVYQRRPYTVSASGP